MMPYGLLRFKPTLCLLLFCLTGDLTSFDINRNYVTVGTLYSNRQMVGRHYYKTPCSDGV
jgi:hypothetical protein